MSDETNETAADALSQIHTEPKRVHKAHTSYESWAEGRYWSASVTSVKDNRIELGEIFVVDGKYSFRPQHEWVGIYQEELEEIIEFIKEQQNG